MKLFQEIKLGKFQPFTSEYVILELDETPDKEKLKKMRDLIGEHNVSIIPASEETKRLADIYVLAGVIPEKYSTDALHIASASVSSIDLIVSLNFKHIVKHKTIIETEIINAREGYKRVFIHTPAEVIDGE